jgi:isopentenyl diphosphate isomerase/L-lactate dehydrogenase-like FMN-dependent dehydrogenase
MMAPELLKARSLGALDIGMARYFLEKLAKVINVVNNN